MRNIKLIIVVHGFCYSAPSLMIHVNSTILIFFNQLNGIVSLKLIKIYHIGNETNYY